MGELVVGGKRGRRSESVAPRLLQATLPARRGALAPTSESNRTHARAHAHAHTVMGGEGAGRGGLPALQVNSLLRVFIP